MAQFSNTDRYLVTYSYPQGPGDPGHIVIWDVERSISIQQQVRMCIYYSIYVYVCFLLRTYVWCK